jgi:hypothetical protein
MATARLLPAYDQFLDMVVMKMSPQEILAFEIPETLQERADELADRYKENQLNRQEIAELEQMMEFDELVSLLKAKALKSLK